MTCKCSDKSRDPWVFTLDGEGEGEGPSVLSHLPTTGPGAQQFELQPEGQGGEGTTIWLPPQVTTSF